MTKVLNAIEAANMEANGEGAFTVTGRTIKFRAGTLEWTWHCRTTKDAAQQLRIFRAAPKYAVAA